MSCDHRLHPVVACATLAFFFVQVSLPLAAPASARLPGRVLEADGVTPRTGVVVALVSVADGSRFASKPSDEHGGFLVDSAPAGTYHVAAQTPEGVFLAPRLMDLGAGDNPGVTLALRPAAQQGEEDPATEGQEDEGEEELPPLPTPEQGMKTWVKWVIAGSIVVGGLGAVSVISDEEEKSSPF